MYGSWECGQSYEQGENLFFESQYLVVHEENSPIIKQRGFIRLTSLEDASLVSQLEYIVDTTYEIKDARWIFTPTSISAQVSVNTLGIITPEFVNSFQENKKSISAELKLSGKNNLTTLYENGEIVTCERKGL